MTVQDYNIISLFVTGCDVSITLSSVRFVFRPRPSFLETFLNEPSEWVCLFKIDMKQWQIIWNQLSSLARHYWNQFLKFSKQSIWISVEKGKFYINTLNDAAYFPPILRELYYSMKNYVRQSWFNTRTKS